MMTIRCLKTTVLIGPLPAAKTTASGLHLPESQQNVPYYVCAIGPKVEGMAVGNRVITPLYFDHITLEDGTGRKLVKADQILGVME